MSGSGRNDAGVIGCTVVNVNGVAFSHFLRIVKNGYFRRCVVLTDKDSATQTEERAQTLWQTYETPGLIAIHITTHSTFEKDLVAANQSGPGKSILLEAMCKTRPINGEKMREATKTCDLNVEDFFEEIREHKAAFAFNLASHLTGPACGIKVPPYIASAFTFLG